MGDPAALSAREAAKAVAAGTLKAEALAEAYLERAEAIEPRLRAFAYLDPDLVRAQARAVDKAKKKKGTLAGVPVGVKDIIDTKDMPTECNSAIYRGRRPSVDADCVAAVRDASGIILGKTVTTEFANNFPGPTGNPYNLAHTPGGSSSGSAAAVAAGIVPFAFGTQTGGSVIRPASYCGCVGYKATRESLSLKGVRPLAATLDTLGLYARTPDDALLFHAAVAGVKDTKPTVSRKPRLAVIWTRAWSRIDRASADVVEDAARRLAPHAEIERVQLPAACDRGFDAQGAVIVAGIARAFETLEKKHRDLLSGMLLDSIEAGRTVSVARLAEAEATRAAGIAAIGDFFKTYDAILTPSSPGEAPKGLQSTGHPEFNRLWTFLGTPCVSLPVGLGPNGLPVGLQMIGARNKDRELLALSDWTFKILGTIPAPSLAAARPMAALQRRAGLALDNDLAHAWAEGDKVLQEMAAKLPRELSYDIEPAHVFVPSRRR